ncbi:MAG: AAA family ATPase [Myxococcota bacterium]
MRENPCALLEGHLSRVGASLFVGPDAACVPRMARELALAVARGESWRGSATFQGAVLYVHIEAPLAPLRADLCSLGVRCEDELHVLYARVDAGLLEQVRQRARSLAPALIVVDPLAALLRAEDEASECPTSTALDRVVDLARDLETQLLALHPIGPEATAQLSALLQSTSRGIDAVGVVGAGGSLRWVGGGRAASTGAPEPRTPCEVQAADPAPAPADPVPDPVPRAAPAISELALRVLEHLRQHPALLSFAELQAALDTPPSELRAALRELLARGRLLADSPGSGARPPRYTGCDPQPGSGSWLRKVRPWTAIGGDAGLPEAARETRGAQGSLRLSS